MSLIIRHAPNSTASPLTQRYELAVISTVDNFVDYYELLHVQASAPSAVIKASYRAMLQKLDHHPDRGGDVEFAQLLNAAAKTLCDPVARKIYDQIRQQQESQSANTVNPVQWAEAGGSPDKAATEKKEEHKKDNADNQNQTRQSLPTKPHCPFCLNHYASVDKQKPSAKGYSNITRCHVCNAARTPITQLPATSSDELRRSNRLEHDTLASVWSHWPDCTAVNCKLSDFSPAGCALKFPEPLELAAVIMVESDIFNAVCIVRHCRHSDDNTYYIGVEFITLDMMARPGALLIASA